MKRTVLGGGAVLVVLMGYSSFILAEINEAPEEPPNYTFNSKVQEHPKFTHEQKIAAALQRLQRSCRDTTGRGIPKQTIIDAARELVYADDAYKAETNRISAFFFYHPRVRDALLVGSGVFVGALLFWTFA